MIPELSTTLAVQRPSGQWTVLFRHQPYAPALWVLLFAAGEELMASGYFGSQWESISAQRVLADHPVGYQTTVGQAQRRLVARLEPLRRFGGAWRPFSLARVLALALAGIPAAWLLRFDASPVTLTRGSRYAELMGAALGAARRLGEEPPTDEAAALSLLVAMAHGLNPESLLVAPNDDGTTEVARLWPREGVVVRAALLGTPVECPTDYVEAMTRARKQWEASW